MVSSLQRGQWHDLAEARPGLNGNFYRSFDDDDGGGHYALNNFIKKILQKLRNCPNSRYSKYFLFARNC